MKKLLRLGIGLSVSFFHTVTVRAADAGATVLPLDHFNKAHAEIVYDYTQRDLEDAPWSTLEADALYLRLHTAVGQKATLDFDLGGLDAQDADTAFYGGAGLRLLLHDAATWRAGAFLQVHYAPGIEADLDGATLDYDLWEVDGGLILSGRIKVAEDLVLMPYAGPVLSSLNLDGEGKDGGAPDFDADSDQPFGGVLGLAFALPEGNTFRMEARWFDEVSFSAAAGIAF